MEDLRTFIAASTSEGEDGFPPKSELQLSDAPTHLVLASNDERLVVAFARGSLAIYDTSALFNEGKKTVEPLSVFPAAPPGVVRQILANPGDLPDLVALRRDAESGGDGSVVEVLDVKQMQSVGGWSLTSSVKDVPTSSEQAFFSHSVINY